MRKSCLRIKLPTATSDLQSPSCKQPKLVNYNIPEDIVVSEILTRLPVKSLLKFRCVSKSWCSLISDDRAFIESHLKNSTNNKRFTHHVIIASEKEDKAGNYIFKQYSFSCWFYNSSSTFAHDKFTVIDDYFSPPKGCVLVGCSNGLCCVKKYVRYSLKDDFFLWNPATGKSYKLPTYVESSNEHHYTLAGFGFDEVHHDYKVLAILFSDHGVLRVRLYSLLTNSWKVVDNNFKTWTYFGCKFGRFLNGKLHWAGGPSLIGNEPSMIYCFDLEKEVHGIVEKPNYDRANGCFLQSIGVLDGCLSCIINYDYKTINVWVMKHYGMKESWHPLFSIPLSLTILDIDTKYEPFCIGQGGEILFYDDDGAHFIVFDPKSKPCTSSCWPDMPAYEADIYVQSLVSPIPPGDCPVSGNVSWPVHEPGKKLKGGGDESMALDETSPLL